MFHELLVFKCESCKCYGFSIWVKNEVEEMKRTQEGGRNIGE